MNLKISDKDIKYIISCGDEFYKESNKKNSRYKSWEYCYSIFYEAHKRKNIDEEYLDYLCLNLAFYLASWGMYRGSSFLLHRDYKVHKEVILELLKEEYKELFGIEVNKYKDEKNRVLLQRLYEKIKDRKSTRLNSSHMA